jgi:hypothetical protein
MSNEYFRKSKSKSAGLVNVVVMAVCYAIKGEDDVFVEYFVVPKCKSDNERYIVGETFGKYPISDWPKIQILSVRVETNFNVFPEETMNELIILEVPESEI